jgi:hypothetical protein
MFAPNALDDTFDRWSFLSRAMAEHPRAIANAALWDAKTQADLDLGTRDENDKFASVYRPCFRRTWR